MSTTVLVSESVATESRRRTGWRDPFFAAMSAVTLLIVISGFTPTLYLRPVFNPPAIPAYLFLRGIVLTSWFVLFFGQALVRSGRIQLRGAGVDGPSTAASDPGA
jgi:hypothetical protein